jgi:hypothetical protein
MSLLLGINTEYLNLYSNHLTGTIPQGLRLRQLIYLDLGRNNLYGTLPEDLGETFIQLRMLHLDHNQFNGTVSWTKYGVVFQCLL